MCWVSKLLSLEDIASPDGGTSTVIWPHGRRQLPTRGRREGSAEVHTCCFTHQVLWLCKCCSWNLFLEFEKLQALCVIYGIMWSYKSSATAKCNNDTLCLTICVSFAWPHLCWCRIAEGLSNGCTESMTEITPASQREVPKGTAPASPGSLGITRISINKSMRASVNLKRSDILWKN